MKTRLIYADTSPLLLRRRRRSVVAVFPSDITVGTSGNSGDIAAASSFSGAAVWNGSARILCVNVTMLGPGVTVTAMTYGGAACTVIGARSTVTSFGRIEQWRIKSSDSGAPPSGSNTLAVTLSGSIEFAVAWTDYNGVHQTSPIEGFNSNQATNGGSPTDATVSITSVANNCMIHVGVVASDTTITAGQTSRNNISGTLGSGANEDSGVTVAPGANVMNYTNVGALATWAIAGFAIRPLAASDLNPTLVAASGVFIFTGQAINFGSASLVAAKGTFVLTGNAVAFTTNTPLSKGTFVLVGNPANLIWSGAPRAAGGGAEGLGLRIGIGIGIP